MKEFIEKFCLTCDKKLIVKPAHDECFNLGHNIRVHGQFSIPVVGPHGNFQGVALNDTKQGESVEIQL